MHCLKNPGAIVLLGRKALPDLKDTILRKVLDHIQGDLVENYHYKYNISTGNIKFYNKSEIIIRSWADKRYTKLRSLELSVAIIEELTENDAEEFEFYKELLARVGRLPHIRQNFILCATNPDAPSHPAYDYFITSKIETRHVYYSVTTDNPFLPKWYIEQLKETFTAQEARRMIYGEWIEIGRDVIYYAFDESISKIESYEIDIKYPIIISYDFNIGLNKPMSACLMQFIGGIFYIFKEVVIFGSNTSETCDEMILKGYLDYPVKYIITGDAACRSKSSKYNRSDYDIIEKTLSNYYGKYGNPTIELDVSLSNPPIRKRHILVNGQLKNSLNQTKVFITKDCPTLIKGLRLAKLKKGGQYIEDDSDSWQHITTALGYAIVNQLDKLESSNNFYQGGIHGDSVEQRNRYSESRISENGHRGYRG